MKTKIFLGFTNNQELSYAEIENNRNENSKYFSVCFSTLNISKMTNEETTSRAESFVDGMDDSYKLLMCDKYDCSPQNLTEEIENDTYEGINMLYGDRDYDFDFQDENGDEIIFEYSSGGQHDTRDSFTGDCELFISRELYNLINDTWDEYHLSEIPTGRYNAMMDMVNDEKSNMDVDELVREYLTKNGYLESEED